jgi:nucleoid-associated protein YgaU
MAAISPIAPTSISISGGENLWKIAEEYLGDATQWWRIANLNGFPGQQPDFIISVTDAQRLNGVLQIPPVNPNAVWP